MLDMLVKGFMRVDLLLQWVLCAVAAQLTAGRWPDLSMEMEMRAMSSAMILRDMDHLLPEDMYRRLRPVYLAKMALVAAIVIIGNGVR